MDVTVLLRVAEQHVGLSAHIVAAVIAGGARCADDRVVDSIAVHIACDTKGIAGSDVRIRPLYDDTTAITRRWEEIRKIDFRWKRDVSPEDQERARRRFVVAVWTRTPM